MRWQPQFLRTGQVRPRPVFDDLAEALDRAIVEAELFGLTEQVDALRGLATLSTIETGLAGRHVVAAGDIPVATTATPINATPVHAAAAQRRLRRARWLVPAFTAGMWVANAIQDRST